jgi:hypothetical protein
MSAAAGRQVLALVVRIERAEVGARIERGAGALIEGFAASSLLHGAVIAPLEAHESPAELAAIFVFEGELAPFVEELWLGVGGALSELLAGDDAKRELVDERAFRRFVDAHSVRPCAFFVAEPALSRAQIQRDAELDDWIQSRLDAMPELRNPSTSALQLTQELRLRWARQGTPTAREPGLLSTAPSWSLGLVERWRVLRLLLWAVLLEFFSPRGRTDETGSALASTGGPERVDAGRAQGFVVQSFEIRSGAARQRVVERALAQLALWGNLPRRASGSGGHFGAWLQRGTRLLRFEASARDLDTLVAEASGAERYLLWVIVLQLRGVTLRATDVWRGRRAARRLTRWARSSRSPGALGYTSYPRLDAIGVARNRRQRELFSGEPNDDAAQALCALL